MLNASTEAVVLKTESLACLLQNYNLAIPDYQRIYCWEEKNVLQLLDDIKNYGAKPYHMGNIILHKREDRYDIVDGQQRLVTLSLLLSAVGAVLQPALLNETFESAEAQQYIGYNKWLIQNYVANNTLGDIRSSLGRNMLFSVLIINDGSLDLAYTFFSNQNSRGKALTDYDLLKAHHLRYVQVEEQAEHLAERWNKLVVNSDNDDTDKDLARTLGIYLFRLRKWMRKKEWNNDEKYRVKTEFEAARIIPNIPAFGQQFRFYESIGGGAHFFGYTDHFIDRFKAFCQTNEFKCLQALSYETHWWYRDVIEALLFAYYLKFGTQYLSDALLGICRVVSEHRFQNSRANLGRLLKHAADSEIVMMIDQATSPTFFFAELKYAITKLPPLTQYTGIRQRYLNLMKELQQAIIKDCHHIFPQLSHDHQ